MTYPKPSRFCIYATLSVYHKKAIATTGNIAAAYAISHAAQLKGGYFCRKQSSGFVQSAAFSFACFLT